MSVPTSKQLPATGHRTKFDFNKNEDEISKKRKRLNSLDIVDDANSNGKGASSRGSSKNEIPFSELDEDAQWEKVTRRLEHKPSSKYHHLNENGKRKYIQKHIIQMIDRESLKAQPPSASLALRRVVLPQSSAVSTSANGSSTPYQDTALSTVTPMLLSRTGSLSGLSDKPPATVSYPDTQSRRGSPADTSEVKEADKDNGYLSVAIKDHVFQSKYVLLGYWGDSPKADIKDKHAIYGVCQSNKTVRIKIAQHTRDRRPIKGLGSGFKVKYDTCIFEKHLKDLMRAEIEEYCRVCVNHHNSVKEPTIGRAIEEARKMVAIKAQDRGLSVAEFNEERCHYLESQISNSASNRLRRRTQPQTASIDQTSDTDFAYTSDFNPNKQSAQVRYTALRLDPPSSAPLAGLLLLEEVRPLDLRCLGNDNLLKFEPICNLEAAVAYTVGDPVQPPCTKCTANHGPFSECIQAVGFLKGSCANCHYDNKGAQCSLRAGMSKKSDKDDGHFPAVRNRSCVTGRDVLLGYWNDSSELDIGDKHAIYGSIGFKGFRVRVVPYTRDGRPVRGNYPLGNGRYLVNYNTCVFEPHLKELMRIEIEEYCRISTADIGCKNNIQYNVIEAKRRVAMQAEIKGLSIVELNDKRCHRLEALRKFDKKRRERAKLKQDAVKCAASGLAWKVRLETKETKDQATANSNGSNETAEEMCQSEKPNTPSGDRRLRKRILPQKACLERASDFGSNEEYEEDTSDFGSDEEYKEDTSDFEANEESREDISSPESSNEHQAVTQQEPTRNADLVSGEIPSIMVEIPRCRRSKSTFNIKPVSNSSLGFKHLISQQDMPQESNAPKSLVVKLAVPSLFEEPPGAIPFKSVASNGSQLGPFASVIKIGLEDGIRYRKHSYGGLSNFFVSLERDTIVIKGIDYVQQSVLVPIEGSQPRLQGGQEEFKMALEGLFEGYLVRPERKVIELDSKDYVKFTVRIRRVVRYEL